MVNPLDSLISCVGAAEPRFRTLRLSGVWSPARTLLTSVLVQGVPCRPALCVAADWKRAERFAAEISFFFSLFRLDGSPPESRREILRFPPSFPESSALAQASWPSVQDRLRTLIALLTPGFSGLVVTSQDALREKVPPRECLARCVRVLRVGETLERDSLADCLQGFGYRRSPIVESPGDYAVRGSLIDVYPLPAEMPFRVDFFGDEIEGIRVFQPETQRSLERVDSLTLTPASLFLAREVDGQGLRRRVKERADALNLSARKRLEHLERIEAGLPVHEVPLHLPFFYPGLHTLLDYLSGGPPLLTFLAEDIRKPALAHREECDRALEHLAAKGRIVPLAEDLFLDFPSLEEGLRGALLVSFPEVVRSAGAPGTGPERPEQEGPGEGRGPGDPGARPEPPLPPAEEPGRGSPGIGAAGFQDGAAGEPTSSPAAAGGEGHGTFHLGFRRLTPDLLPGSEERKARGLAGAIRLVQGWLREGMRVFLVCGSEPEKMRLGHLLHEYEMPFIQPQEKLPLWESPPGLYLLRGELSQGFLFPDGRMVFLHEEDIFGRKVRRPSPRERLAATTDARDLKPGDHVVHIDFGIGHFQGLETLNIRGLVNDYLLLQYANNDRLYLPVDRASRIQKYISTEDLPPTLDKLGGGSWLRAKKKVRESILAMAQELVSLYAVRLVKKGYAFSRTDPSYEEFEAAFPFEETPDQMRAIEEVLQDMEKERPMDRLVCGDVGYGKTEVAIRAAYKAVMDGKQVAVLVPTTVLAQQHHGNFLARFEGYPVQIGMLSRFRSAREQRLLLEGLVEGKVDIVIGTHRLLQRDVKFRDLGLLILDEEHRFGVRHKESLKKIRTEVDVLTLTATPIPRTLQMSLLGLRDLSTIKTPPQDRHAIETFVVPHDPEIIRRAIDFELSRGGQAFFVHNRVSDIGSMAQGLQAIVPRARIAIGHGQMPEKELERVMLEFVEGRHDILVCTTIIESGLDIPNANTLIVNRADRFGLAQLYQLRGRVGRAERQAYTYLIVPDEDSLTGDARKRLEALYEFTELGSGFRIARYDMEIRGAGNLLGTSQSGQIRAVGYDLYMEYLERAIRELKGEEIVEEIDPEIHFEMPAYLPAGYIEDSSQRLSFYKRLASAGDHDEVERILAEIRDRYGEPPEQAQTLFDLIRIKVRLRRLRIREARLAAEGLLLSFAPHTPVAVRSILEWAAREPDRVRLFPDDRLLVRFSARGGRERLRNIETILTWLEKGTRNGEAPER